MTTDPASPPGPPRWLHRLAVLTVCAAVPLLLLGAEVTTKGAGMADPKGFHPPWYLVALLREEVDSGGTNLAKIIEYSHRLAGFLVGVCAIGLAAGLWLGRGRPWLRWLGLAALAAVCLQGLLGIFRVNLNAVMGSDLALVHGCFAQLVFALLVSVALFTSRGWGAAPEAPADPKDSVRLWRWALAITGLVYLQIIFGAVVRHRDVPFGARVHLLVAFGVVAAVAWLVKLALDSRPRSGALTGPVLLLAGLVGVQLVLGVESWLSRFPSPMWNQAQPLPVHPELFRTLHYLVGSLVFATALVVTLQAYRRTVPAVEVRPAPVGRWEGAV
jgi:heme A synthase